MQPARLLKKITAPIAAVALAFAAGGCAESPFRIAQHVDENSIRVEIDANDNLRIEGIAYKNAELAGRLNELGIKYVGRPVALILDTGADPKAEPYVRLKAKDAGLGEVVVVQRDHLAKGYRTRPARTEEQFKADEAKKYPPAQTSDTAGTAPATGGAAAGTAGTAPAAPAEAAPPPQPAEAAPPAPPPAEAAPPAAAPAPETIAIHVNADGSLLIAGSAVAPANLDKTLADIIAAKPTITAEISYAPGTTGAVLYPVIKAIKNAKFSSHRLVHKK
jgi:biopolymer transport protein ExbD